MNSVSIKGSGLVGGETYHHGGGEYHGSWFVSSRCGIVSWLKVFRCVLASLYEGLSVHISLCPPIRPSVRPLTLRKNLQKPHIKPLRTHLIARPGMLSPQCGIVSWLKGFLVVIPSEGEKTGAWKA